MSGPSHRNSSFSSVVNTALVSTGIGAIKQRSTKDQAKSNKDVLPQDKTAVHLLAEKLTLHNIKFNTMVD